MTSQQCNTGICISCTEVEIKLDINIIDYFEETNKFMTLPIHDSIDLTEIFFPVINYDTDCRLKNGSVVGFDGLLTSFSNVDENDTDPTFMNSTLPSPTDPEMTFQSICINIYSEVVLRVYLCKYAYKISTTPPYLVEYLFVKVFRYMFIIKRDQNTMYGSNNVFVCLDQSNYTQALSISYPNILNRYNLKCFDLNYGYNQAMIDNLSNDPLNNDLVVRNYITNFMDSFK